MEATFQRTHYPDVSVVDRLSDMLHLTTERIAVWFQNRRARFKKLKKEPTDSIIQDNDMMLREVEKLLDANTTANNNSSCGNSLNASVETETPAKAKQTPNMQMPNNVLKSPTEPNDANNDTVSSPNNSNHDSQADNNDAISQQVTVKTKPIFNPMNYSPPPCVNSTNTVLYQPYQQDASFFHTNMPAQQNEYYAYAPVQGQLKLPVIKSESNDSEKSSRSSTPDEQSDASDSSSSPQNSDEMSYANLNTSSYPFVDMNQQQQQQPSLSMYHHMGVPSSPYHPHYHPHQHHQYPNFFQHYYNMPDFHHQNSAYFPGLHSQLATDASNVASVAYNHV